MRKIYIKLIGTGGPLDTHAVTINEGEDEDAQINKAVAAVVSDWTLAVGDSIIITEEE